MSALSVSMRRRIAVGVAAMLLPLLLVAGASTWALQTTLGLFRDTAEEAIEDALPLTRLETQVYGLEVTGVRAVLLSGDPAARTAYLDARHQTRAAFNDLLDQELTEEGALVRAAQGHTNHAIDLLDDALMDQPAPSEGQPLVDQLPQLERIHNSAVQAAAALDEASLVAEDDIIGEYEQGRQVQQQALGVIAGVIVIGLLAAAAGGFYLQRLILRPLGVLREATHRLRDGVLSHRVALRGDDEFGQLGQAFNTMAGELERNQRELAHQALHDALTGLPNRVLLQDRVDQALARSCRAGRQVALLLIDLDGFKGVNDSLGHGAGDGVLASAAERLQLCLRPEDTAARLGGDEFAVLVEADTRALALGVAERILRSVRPVFSHDGQDLFLTASIGVAFSGPDRPVSGQDLLRDADLAMYRAKHAGKDAVCVFDPTMHDDAADRLRLDGQLRGALQRGELSLAYQPIYSIDGRSLVAVEALMRWDHPERGPVSPVEFIPIAESSGLILTLGAWALDEACRQLRVWQDDAGTPAADQLQISVNLSARQLTDDALPDLVARALADHDIAAHRLILEITESMLITDVPGTIRRLRELKTLGVQLAIDDFGTGYSSLGYLQQFPIDRIKIDKSFVDRLGTPEGKALAEGIINLARSLTLEPIAEGIEDSTQLAALDELGCLLGQGYHFAKPELPSGIARRLTTAALAIPPTPRPGTPKRRPSAPESPRTTDIVETIATHP